MRVAEWRRRKGIEKRKAAQPDEPPVDTGNRDTKDLERETAVRTGKEHHQPRFGRSFPAFAQAKVMGVLKLFPTSLTINDIEEADLPRTTAADYTSGQRRIRLRSTLYMGWIGFAMTTAHEMSL